MRTKLGLKDVALPTVIFVVLQFLFNFYYLSHYSNQIISKNLSIWVIIEFVALGNSGFISSSAIYTILIATSISYNLRPRTLKITPNKTLLILASSFLIFAFESFFQPRIYAKQLSLTYSIYHKKTTDPLDRGRADFEDHISTFTLTELITSAKALSKQKLSSDFDESADAFSGIQKRKQEIISMIWWPITSLLFFGLGFSIGILTMRRHWLWVVPLNLFGTIPIWWYTKKFFLNLTFQSDATFFLGLFVPTFLFSGVCLLMYLKSRNSVA